MGEIKNSNLQVNCLIAKSNSQEEVKSFVYYYALRPDMLGKSPDFILPDTGSFSANAIPLHSLPANCNQFYVAVTALDRDNNESEMSNFILIKRIGGDRWKVEMGDE